MVVSNLLLTTTLLRAYEVGVARPLFFRQPIHYNDIAKTLSGSLKT
ncbi:MAG: hypothetical protein IKI11_04325 [Neisseriaceae bacterium]|nr:hypothetical protein [Neisseriaceae bacterium]